MICDMKTAEFIRMKRAFEIRTNQHCKRVQDNWESLYNTEFAEYFELNKLDYIKHITGHDRSKFTEPEFTPYIFINWKYKMDKEGKDWEIPDNMKKRCHEATVHHVISNPHHPEYWDLNPADIINPISRDKPTKRIINATLMLPYYIIEMVCDWKAVSDERGTSLIKWADDNIGIRWKFNETQTKLIYKLIKGDFK